MCNDNSPKVPHVACGDSFIIEGGCCGLYYNYILHLQE